MTPLPPRFVLQMTAIAPLTLCWWLSSAAPALTGDSGVDAAAVLAVGAQMFAQLADAASAGGALPLLILLWTGVVTCAVCCVAEAKALGTLSSSEATVIFATEPLWAVVFALLLLDEVNQAPIFPTCDTPSHPLFSHISAFSSFSSNLTVISNRAPPPPPAIFLYISGSLFPTRRLDSELPPAGYSSSAPA